METARTTHLEQALASLRIRIGIAQRRRPANVAGALHTNDAQIERLLAKEERLVALIAKAKEEN